MQTQLLIDGRDVTKIFRDFWGRPKVTAVSGVDIAVPQGTVFGLLGPNGAGKSTLIKMILGHLYPTRGTLTVLGHSPRDVSAKQRLGYLPERAAFYGNLTSAEVLSLYGRILGLSESEILRRSEQLLDMVGLQHARRRRVREFSHGMGRRLGLAQALLNDPDLVLLDEPTAGLDPVGCHEVKTLIGTLAARGKTVLMSSHLLADVQDVCDRVMVMYGGRVLQVGAVEELLARTDEVQIRAPAVSDDVLSQVRSLLTSAGGADAVEVSRPSRTLEEYFLGLVEAASRSNAETAGARVGKGVADYLKGDREDTELLDELSKAGKTPEPMSESRTDTPDVDKAELDRLTSDTPDRQTAGPAADDGEPDVDKDLLDKLTKQ
jgi:ABC-2 type transport system ATP-binding protein